MSPFLRNLFKVLIFLFIFLIPSLSHATPGYAQQTGLECQRCHVDATGGKLRKGSALDRGQLLLMFVIALWRW